MNNWTGFARTAVAAAVAVVAVAPALAQNTTSAISGRIVGPDGKGVAGASVSVVHVESGTTNTVTTDAEGRFAARGLRAGGPFTVTVTKGGQTERREGVFLALAETLSLDLPLGATQTITVTGRSASSRFDASATGAGTGVNNRELNAYASVQRNLQDYARIDPRIAQTDKQNGEISALGQNTRFNSITIDGVTTNDTFGLEANNLPTKKQPVSIDAIQSVQINLSNYDVTQKGYTGANVNAVTKSGTNDFHGSLYYVWRNEDYAGARFNRTNGSYAPPAPFKDYTKGFTLGGPIIKDRLFFFASYEEYISSKTAPSNGPLGSTLTNVAITQAAIDSATAIAKSKWNLDVGGSALPDGLALKVKDTLLKLDWNINNDHRASVRYSKTEQSDPTLNGFSNTALSVSSYWFTQAKTLETLVGQWFADWTPTFSTELKASKRDYDSVPTPLLGRMPAMFLRFSGTPTAPDAPVPGVNYNNRTLSMGTEESRHLNVLRTKTDDLYGGATWSLGDHEMKFGADYARNEIYNAFLQNIYGSYTFACEPGTYSNFSIPTAGGGCNNATVTQAQRDQAVLENFQRGLPSAYAVQVPLPGRVIGDGAATWRYENTGLFVQDTWRVSSSLNFLFGARIDTMKVPTKPLFNAGAAATRVAGRVTDATGAAGAGSVVRDTGGFGYDNSTTLDNTELFQPRFGFNWKLPSKTQRMQLRGGVGLFQGAAANVWLSNPFSNPGVAVTSFNCNNFAACNGGNSSSTATLTSVFSPNPDAPATLTGTPPGANVDFISPKLRQPSLWKLNIAFDTELPELPVVGSLVAGAELVHSKVKSGIYYKNLNLGDPTRTGPDGRDMFWMPQSYNPNCWNGSTLGTANVTVNGVPQVCAGGRDRALSNASFGRNILLAEKTSKGGGDALTLSLNMPTGPAGVSWTVAYTRTTAKEVSPLTSSTSNSNWNLRSIFNPNEEVLQNSNYLIKDRVSAAFNWSKALFDSKNRTTVGLFYEGRRGKPYSWTFINDMNGDGFSNDLMYIPKGPGSGEVVFKGGATEEAQFWNIVDANKALSGAKGGVVGRNNTSAPWVNNFDLRVKQELPGFSSQHKASVTVDILNVGNLLNRQWGRIDEVPFPSRRSFVNYNGIDSSGRYVYSLGSLTDFTTRQTVGESQWAAQITLRYEF